MKTKILDKLANGGALCVVGLGYVGLPLAIAFAKKVKTIGFDINEDKIKTYQKGIDLTYEVGDQAVMDSQILFTSDPKQIKEADFVIVAVPTPVYSDNNPDLRPLAGASQVVGQNLKKGAIVCFESTVYPGITENYCGPIIAKASGLKARTDFKLAYSPERINPGDQVHRLTNIKKIVSGQDKVTCQAVKSVYDLVIEETVPVSSIKAAEAIKVTENTQRDVNIAFMNECAGIFDKLGIDTGEVLKGMRTKWNALDFKPGLVGGHCIGVDPYYLINEAEKVNADAMLLKISREINNQAAFFVRDKTLKLLTLTGLPVKGMRVGVLGITFKENVGDARNSKVIDIINGLKEYGIEVLVYDPYADPRDIWQKYGVKLAPRSAVHDLNGLVVAVAHREFLDLDLDRFFKKDLVPQDRVLVDVKSIYPKERLEKLGYSYWQL
ncbi:nucleotide sugar dehydrogenase [Lactobacillus equicursoris]|uniref:nucleotide sugar dehydrogenase n=1 Tax=Lactobacillus equicursoris TaxID=420645 RepID=UPI0039933DC7